ncbi:MAG: GreA/GreB family elongation factor [Sandaracinaceae bacterium]|nr:GreA/GreB family elongation factor [Sandaracinaceae bacterium]
MDKLHLLEQLRSHIQRSAEGAMAAAVEAASEARDAADPRERSADAGTAVEHASMARGQTRRRDRALAELSALEYFEPRPFDETAKVRVGALVEIEDEETGEGRTFFLAPAGAGTTLTGPDGDGLLTVVTPHSPVGRAVIGQRVGDVIDVTFGDDGREWTITWVG